MYKVCRRIVIGMSKHLDKVRKSIGERRKMRRLTNKEQTSPRYIYPGFPSEEEKHGYFPEVAHDVEQGKRGKQTHFSQFAIKGLLALTLFVGTAFVLKTDGDILTLPKKWTRHAMTEEFPFARVHDWYQTTFGTPMGMSPKSDAAVGQAALALPVNGDVTESFHTNGTGIKIMPEEATEVTALRDGIVIFAGKDKDTGNTVVIQHSDGSESTYGQLDDLNVHVYQMIATGEELGNFKPTESHENIYFAIEKDNKYIDPVKVIKVDESS